MARTPSHRRRKDDFKPGRVDPWGEHVPSADDLAKRVSYCSSGKHKNYPAPNGEWRPVHRPGTALCAHFPEAERPKLLKALRQAIQKSCVQLQAGKEFPTRAWAYNNGTLHEARITNPTTGEYHGFPLEYESQMPDDPHDLLRNAPHVDIAFT